MTITVYGASDDLIEVEGDITEEFGYTDDPDVGDVVGFSDGTVLRLRYTDEGYWRITPAARGSAELRIEQATEDASDDDGYTDRAVVDGDIRWVVHGRGFAARRNGGSSR